jgi:cytochrome P450
METQTRTDTADPPPPAARARRHYLDLAGPRAWPIVGNLRQIDKTAMHRSLEELAQRYGPVFRFRVGPAPAVVVSDAALVRQLLRDRPQAVVRSPWLNSIMRELGLTGVFTAEGDDWRRQRLLMTRTFTPELVARFYPTAAAMVQRLMDRWSRAVRQGGAIDFGRDLKAFTMDVTVAFAMGEDVNALESAESSLQADIDFLFKQVGRRTTTPLPYWRWLRLAEDRAADAAAQRVRSRVIDVIAQARARGAAGGARKANLLESMIAAQDAPDSEFSDEMVVGNAFTVVFAGEDTTAASLSWALVLLARHPDVAQRVADEARGLGRPDGSELGYDDLAGAPYIEAVVHECMRLHPAAPMLPLSANEDLLLGDVLVPAGTRILLLMRRAWMTSGEFDAAERFDPQRWLAAGVQHSASDPNRRTFPFGGGPRFCPGRHLALVEMKAVLAALFRRFDLVAADASPPVHERLAVTMNPDVMPIRLVPRDPLA